MRPCAALALILPRALATTAATAQDTPAAAPAAGQVTVLTAARIHTEDRARPQATAIAWDGQGRILATGSARSCARATRRRNASTPAPPPSSPA